MAAGDQVLAVSGNCNMYGGAWVEEGAEVNRQGRGWGQGTRYWRSVVTTTRCVGQGGGGGVGGRRERVGAGHQVLAVSGVYNTEGNNTK